MNVEFAFVVLATDRDDRRDEDVTKQLVHTGMRIIVVLRRVFPIQFKVQRQR